MISIVTLAVITIYPVTTLSLTWRASLLCYLSIRHIICYIKHNTKCVKQYDDFVII